MPLSTVTLGPHHPSFFISDDRKPPTPPIPLQIVCAISASNNHPIYNTMAQTPQTQSVAIGDSNSNIPGRIVSTPPAISPMRIGRLIVGSHH